MQQQVLEMTDVDLQASHLDILRAHWLGTIPHTPIFPVPLDSFTDDLRRIEASKDCRESAVAIIEEAMAMGFFEQRDRVTARTKVFRILFQRRTSGKRLDRERLAARVPG